jgi:hypothetical protein
MRTYNSGNYTVNGMGEHRGAYTTYMNPSIYSGGQRSSLFGLGQDEGAGDMGAQLIGLAVGGFIAGLAFSMASKVMPIKTTR